MRTLSGGWAFVSRLAIALLLCACAGTSPAIAAPITYTFTSTASGTLGTTPFTGAAITVTASADSSTVTVFTAGDYCNSLASVTFAIAGVGSGSVTDALAIVSNNAAPGVALEAGNDPVVFQVESGQSVVKPDCRMTN